jgi:hypothetical protein
MHTMSIPRLSLLGLFLLAFRLETIEVSAWVPVLRNNLPRIAATPHRRHIVTTIYSTVEESTGTSTETSSATTERQHIIIPMPTIQYSVPGMKLGWKENGVWMDEDGPRNGPPQNFWRQMSDERVFNSNLDLIKDLLKMNSFEANDMTNEIITRLEKTNSIRVPTLNRLVLGDWAPIVRGGKLVATGSTTDVENTADVPYRFNIQRTAGHKLAPKTHYGTLDKHLEPGEEITVQKLSSSNAITSSGVLEMPSNKNENMLVNGYDNATDGDLYVGGITYITRYIMIMRQEAQRQETEDEKEVVKGPVTEIWMRTDPQ